MSKKQLAAKRADFDFDPNEKLNGAFNLVPVPKIRPARGRGGSLMDRAANWSPCDPSLILLGEKKENK